ncbi:TetR/AcrR family transcriptional regulator [Clostridium sp. Marseille-Q7071]
MEKSTKEIIIEKATKIIELKGVKNTSLSDISKECEISKGTLYYYYPTKDELIYDIADRHLKALTDQLVNWIETIEDESSPEEILSTVYKSILSQEFRGKLHIYLISEALMGNKKLEEYFKENYNYSKEAIIKGLKKIYKKNDNSFYAMASLISATIDGFLIQNILKINEIPIETITKFIVANYNSVYKEK